MALVFSAFTSILIPKGAIVDNEVELQPWIEALAKRIQALGLAELARLGLDLVRPLGFLGAQTLLVAQPLVNGFVGDATIERALALLESPRLQDYLVMSLEKEKG